MTVLPSPAVTAARVWTSWATTRVSALTDTRAATVSWTLVSTLACVTRAPAISGTTPHWPTGNEAQ
jgi:hypothetical protein